MRAKAAISGRTACGSQPRELAQTGKLAVRVGATYPLERAADAQRTLAVGGTRGKIVIEIT